MKKIFAGIALSSFIFNMLCFQAYANTVEIKSAKQNEDGNVEVACTLSGEDKTENIVVFSCEYMDETYMNDIIYTDEMPIETDENGDFEFDFIPSEQADTENKVYVVRVGGENIDVPDSRIIAFYDGKIYVTGDIDGDGDVDRADAALLLRYLSGIGVLTGQQLTVADINETNDIDFEDVISLLEIIENKQPTVEIE
jgi:hypothetical protein